MDFLNINWMAVIAAAASAFLVGGFWYSKVLFWNAWKEDSDLTTELLKTRNHGQVFGFTASFSILMAANLAISLPALKSMSPGAPRRVFSPEYGYFQPSPSIACLS